MCYHSHADSPGVHRARWLKSIREMVCHSRCHCRSEDHDGGTEVGAGELLQREGRWCWRVRVPHRFRTRLSDLLRQGWRNACDFAGRRDEERPGSRHRNCSCAVAGLQEAQVAGEVTMPLTREFKETVQARIKQDRKYRKELLREGVECLLAGDLDTGKAILRDYINATIGFEELSRLTKRPAKSLMRMLGPQGNPQARNLFEVIGHLQRAEGLQFELSLRAAS